MQLVHTASRETRLLSILRHELALSSGLVKRLKWQGAFRVNGAVARTGALVRPGDRITVDLSEQPTGFPAEDRPLEILYEDECMLALDKPRGMLVHPSPQRNTGTLANAVLGYYARTGQACGVHPVTRLDRDTFGVVLLAKNAYIHEKFCEMQRNRQICKVYHASVFGGPRSERGVITLPIARRGGRSLLRIVAPGGKECRTVWRVLARGEGEAVLELRPVTGRTHQLRVHCLYAGYPILGDPQYQTDESAAFSARRGLQTQELCAKRLEFRHPMTGAPVLIESRQRVYQSP